MLRAWLRALMPWGTILWLLLRWKYQSGRYAWAWVYRLLKYVWLLLWPGALLWGPLRTSPQSPKPDQHVANHTTSPKVGPRAFLLTGLCLATVFCP